MPQLLPYTGANLFQAAGDAGNAVGRTRGNTFNEWDAARTGLRAGFGVLHDELAKRRQVKDNQAFLSEVESTDPGIAHDPMWGYLKGRADAGDPDLAKAILQIHAMRTKDRRVADSGEHTRNADALARDKALGTLGPDGQLVPGSIQQGATRATAAATNAASLQDRREAQTAQGDVNLEMRRKANAEIQDYRDTMVALHDTQNTETARHNQAMEARPVGAQVTEDDANYEEAKVHHANVSSIAKRANSAYMAAVETANKNPQDANLQTLVKQRRQDRNRAFGDLDAAGRELEDAAGTAKRSHIHPIVAPHAGTASPSLAPEAPPVGKTPAQHVADVAAEHPDWPRAQVIAEAKRRAGVQP